MRESPQFSVVVPLYNKRAYIRRAVDSVLAQTLTDFELIVVDDGSTDGSIEVLNDISDARLRIIQQQNQGEGPARNTGMGIARAKWIALLDADDAWLEFHLLELAKIANTFPEPGLISTSCVEGTGMKNPAPATPKSGSTIRKIDYFLEASRQIGFINSTSAAVHRQVFEKIGGFTKAKAGADLEYWARIALNYPVAVSRMVTCTYFRDTNGVMQQISKVQLNHRSKPLLYLREISPSLAMLCGRADFYPDLCRNSSIRSYVNSRIVSTIIAEIYRGDPDAAHESALLMILPRKIKHLSYCLLTKLPNTFIRRLIILYRQFRKIKYKS